MDMDIDITSDQAATPRQQASAAQAPHVAANISNIPNLQVPNLNRRVHRDERDKLYERVPPAFEPFARQVQEISAEEVLRLSISLVSNHI